MTPPVLPEIGDAESAINFDVEQKSSAKLETFKPGRKFEGNQLPFVGFTTCSREGQGVAPSAKGAAATVAAGTTAGSAAEIEVLNEDNAKLRLELGALKAEFTLVKDSRDQLKVGVRKRLVYCFLAKLASASAEVHVCTLVRVRARGGFLQCLQVQAAATKFDDQHEDAIVQLKKDLAEEQQNLAKAQVGNFHR